jgi:hypothetical protein
MLKSPHTCTRSYPNSSTSNPSTTASPQFAPNWIPSPSSFRKPTPGSLPPAPRSSLPRNPTPPASLNAKNSNSTSCNGKIALANTATNPAPSKPTKPTKLSSTKSPTPKPKPHEPRVKNAEANLREAEKSVNAEKQQILALNSEKKKALQALLAQRERVIAPIPDDMRVLYDRIAKRHHGTALAEARDGQCKGCGLRVLPHIEQLLKSETDEEVYRCESCGLILYSLQPIPIVNKPEPGDESAAATSATH